MKPCASCPWRRRATLGLWSADHLLSICYARTTILFPTATMGCHKGADSPIGQRDSTRSGACGGWTRVAQDTVAVRWMYILGRVRSDDLRLGKLDLYPDPETMLRWNGFDVDRLPPREPQLPTPTWEQQIVELASTFGHPDRALAYVFPHSPLGVGLTDDFRPAMSRKQMHDWKAECREWEARRVASLTYDNGRSTTAQEVR